MNEQASEVTMYRWETSIKLHEADAAGVLFFANYFRIAHDAYEAMMADLGFAFRGLIEDGDFLPLIVHAESDYSSPLYTGDRVTIEITPEKIGRSSYHLKYEIRKDDNSVAATLRTVHVTIDKKRKKPIALPEQLSKNLQKLT